MKKIEYTDEKTFITEEVEFKNEHYDIAKNLHKQYESELCSECTPIMVRKDKQSLVFYVNFGDKLKDRIAYERGDNMYRVIIERVCG
jgi:hypothetical protein